MLYRSISIKQYFGSESSSVLWAHVLSNTNSKFHILEQPASSGCRKYNASGERRDVCKIFIPFESEPHTLPKLPKLSCADLVWQKWTWYIGHTWELCRTLEVVNIHQALKGRDNLIYLEGNIWVKEASICIESLEAAHLKIIFPYIKPYSSGCIW